MSKRLHLKFPLLSDPERSAISAYGVAMKGRAISIPAVFVLDRSKKVLFRHIGTSMTDRPGIEDLLQAIP